MRRHCIVAIISLLAIGTQAIAQNTNSPYSRFGVGTIKRPGSALNHAMGGTGIALRIPNQINYLNPASYNTQDTMSFLFDAGLFYNTSNLSTETSSHQYSTINIDRIAMAFPMINHRWYASIGVTPYSYLGYKIQDRTINPSVGPLDYFYEGQGGLTQVYFGNSVTVAKGLSLGLNASYLFGSLINRYESNAPFDPSVYDLFIDKRAIVNGFIFSSGAQYEFDLDANNKMTLGLVYELNGKVKARMDQIMVSANTFTIGSSTYSDRDTIVEEKGSRSSIFIPSKVGLGVSYTYNNRFTAALEYNRQDWGNSSFLGVKDSLGCMNMVNAGIQYIPNPRAISQYWQKIRYRAGAYYGNSYLNLKDEQLKEYGFSVGLGIPIRNSKNLINISYEYGKLGTKTNGLILESYQTLTINLTLYDIWFYKRKFD